MGALRRQELREREKETEREREREVLSEQDVGSTRF
jgi:hypothetical protein